MAFNLPKFKLKIPALKGEGKKDPAKRAVKRSFLSFGGSKEKLALGLDIGSHAVKVCELSRSGEGFKLLAVGSARMPPEAVEDGALVEPAAVAEVISKLLANLGSKNRKVAISVSGYSVIVKKISLRVMDPKELKEHIQNEAEQYIPFDIEDVYLDCQDLHTNAEGDEYTEVMLVAAKKELVDGYLDMLAQIGLNTVVVDVDAFALENAFEAGYLPNENVILVDIGAAKMNINILSGGISVLTRDVILGGYQLSEQLSQALDFTHEEAEEIKLGLTQPPEEKRERVEQIIQESCRQWAEEIKRALDLYMTTNKEHPVNRIYISGGGAKMVGLADFLARECELPCQRLNPFANTGFDHKKMDSAYIESVAPEMSQAVGLATRQVEI